MASILMIVGSLRANSFNRRMAEQIEACIAGRAEVAWLDCADMPFMNQDIEHPAPEAVTRARRAVMAADGLWICTPEYNYAVPGGLKNLLDWLSRPLTPNDWEGPTAVSGKPAAISSAAGKSAGAEARAALRRLLEAMNLRVIGGDGTGIILSPEAFTTGEAAFSKGDIAALKRQADEFLEALI